MAEVSMDIGVLGGTFDPIHLGHLTIAAEAIRRLGLSRVIFVPAGKPWLKVGRKVTPVIHRVEMVKMAIVSNPKFGLSSVEVDRPGPSYTVDTLASLQGQLGVETRLFFLLGWDSLAELPLWREPTKLVTMCRMVAFTRKDASPPDMEALDVSVPGVAVSTILLDIAPVDISSSDVRRRVVEGLSLGGMVPEEVERYIAEKKLYLQNDVA